MNFASCNRLLEEKQFQMNTRYHHLKLQQIKQSRNRQQKPNSKILTTRRRFQETERQRQIAKDNQILLNKLSTIIDKPSAIQIYDLDQKSRKMPEIINKSPNTKQRSFYSVKQFKDQFKEHKRHLKIASRMTKQSISKSTKDTYNEPPSSNKIVFQEMIKLFGNLGLERPRESEMEEPENLAQRIVLSRKTTIIEGTPYLIEFSSASKNVFIVAYNMSSANSPVIRMRLSEKDARNLFKESNYDYESIANKISISGSKLIIKDSLRQSVQEPDEPFRSQKKYYSVTKNKRKRNRIRLSNNIKLSEYIPSVQLNQQMCSLLDSDRQTSSKMKNNGRVSKRYNTDSEEDIKKFSMAVTMKKRDGEDYGNMFEKETQKIFRVSGKKELGKEDRYRKERIDNQNQEELILPKVTNKDRSKNDYMSLQVESQSKSKDDDIEIIYQEQLPLDLNNESITYEKTKKVEYHQIQNELKGEPQQQSQQEKDIDISKSNLQYPQKQSYQTQRQKQAQLNLKQQPQQQTVKQAQGQILNKAIQDGKVNYHPQQQIPFVDQQIPIPNDQQLS